MEHALLALNEARRVGVTVSPEVWNLARAYYQQMQKADGTWQLSRGGPPTTDNICAGITGLVISKHWDSSPPQSVRGNRSRRPAGHPSRGVHDSRSCVSADEDVQTAIDALTDRLSAGGDLRAGRAGWSDPLWPLQRAGYLTGRHSFGRHDWYRRGAEDLVGSQSKEGAWKGSGDSSNELWATCYALDFLANWRCPILINKLRHLPANDWENDAEDVSNLVAFVSRDRRSRFSWQIVYSGSASVDDLLQAPILFLNGHLAPWFTKMEMKTLRQYIERGGSILADACCSSPRFDSGFREFMNDLFPENEHKLRPLPDSHPVWRARFALVPENHSLWGVQHGSRTAVLYSRNDLSCGWNEMDRAPGNETVIQTMKLGANIIAYFTGQGQTRQPSLP
jgi:hypothetical protein